MDGFGINPGAKGNGQMRRPAADFLQETLYKFQAILYNEHEIPGLIFVKCGKAVCS